MRSARTIVLWLLLPYATAECPSEKLSPPQLYAGGTFYYPNGPPQCFSKGSQMNVSGSSVYDATNMYLVQGDNFNGPVGVVLNTASTWHE
ncbi:hypothetical protein BJX96DRAFT_81921 [Aspergillus floccosus]